MARFSIRVCNFFEFWFQQTVLRVFYCIFYFMKFKFNNIQFKQIPKFSGMIRIISNGHCKLGTNLIFNNTFKSNPMGLAKRCSIFVAEGAFLEIGDNCGFSAVSIYCQHRVSIGNYLFCGGNVSIWDTDFHPIWFADRRADNSTTTKSLPIVIGDDVFIGANSIILKGVKIGNRSVIGAGSVVTKNIPEDEIWAGNPAKFIKKILP